MPSSRQDTDTTEDRAQRKAPSPIAAIVVGVAVVIGVSSVVWALNAGESPTAAGAATSRDDVEDAAAAKYPVTIRKPAGPPRVTTEIVGAAGNTVTVSCSTCHVTRQPNIANKAAKDLNEFHRGLEVSHGSISCLACHNPNDYDALKLADGTRVEYSDVMTLCAQCHGPQMRDYEHNAHGGLNGYWDRSRGPQSKLNCVDCHHPHAPQFPKMHPTFKPQDRFLTRPGADH